MPIQIQSGDPAFDDLPPSVAQWLDAASLTLALGPSNARGFRAGNAPVVALREHATALEAAVYFDADNASALDVWLEAPLPDGSLFNSYAPLDALTSLNTPTIQNAASPPAQMPPGASIDSTLAPTALAPTARAVPDGSRLAAATAAFVDTALFFDDEIRRLRLSRESLAAESESRAVQAAFRVWQASGDSAAMQKRLPVLQRALDQMWKHPARWSSELDLPKRPFTIDSWPVSYRGMSTHAGEQAGKATPSTSTPSASTPSTSTPSWCVHPGDAAQLFAACRALQAMLEASGETASAALWRERSEHLEAQVNSVGWNGAFYTHQIHISPLRVRGVDEARQLAACNLIAINAGLASQEQCASILREYARRRELQLETSFCEWWPIQPPFPITVFGIEPGIGPNGGIWPQIGGELALAALRHGFESVGVETLRRYYDLAVKPRRTFPWYSPDGQSPRDASARVSDQNSNANAASEQASASKKGKISFHGAHEYSWDAANASNCDAAGAASMLRALAEGVCGVRDLGAAFGRIELAPRWPATGMASANVEISYAANPAYVSYRWALDGGRMTLDYECQAKHIDLHILLPRGNTPERVALNGRTCEYALVTIEKSKYVDISTERKRGTVAITLK